MKYLILSLLLPVASFAKSDLVTCQLQDFKNCTDCTTRIPASCENHVFNGSLDLKLKPKSIQWTVSNSKTSGEKLLTTENSKLTLNDLKLAKDLKTLAKQLKVTLSPTDTLTLVSVQLPGQTALYKNQTDKQIASHMQAQNNLRNIASSQEPSAGGVRRAKPKQK
jgi:hypothetical protein